MVNNWHNNDYDDDRDYDDPLENDLDLEQEWSEDMEKYYGEVDHSNFWDEF